jgi:uncharacterized protein YodC (DUF2158 family)
MAFKVGLRLKSGGPPMTIATIDDDGVHNYARFQEREKMRLFLADTLEPVQAGQNAMPIAEWSPGDQQSWIGRQVSTPTIKAAVGLGLAAIAVGHVTLYALDPDRAKDAKSPPKASVFTLSIASSTSSTNGSLVYVGSPGGEFRVGPVVDTRRPTITHPST